MTTEELEARVSKAIWCKNSAKVLSMHDNYAEIELKNDDPNYAVRISKEDLDTLYGMGFDTFGISVVFGVVTIQLYWDQDQFDEADDSRKSKTRKRVPKNKKATAARVGGKRHTSRR